jgi:hypothetical protein
MLVEEQVRVIHPHDGRDLSAELEGIRACVDGIGGERATEAGQLSRLVMEISNVLADLGMLLVQDIPQLPKLAQEALTVVGLFLERLREVQASDVGPWDSARANRHTHGPGLSTPPSFGLVFIFRSGCNVQIHTLTHTHTSTPPPWLTTFALPFCAAT